MTLGQEFSGYAACIERGADDVEQASEQLKELNLGATAVGTGLNAGDDYTRLADVQPRALARDRCQAGREPVPRHAEHGRRRSPTRARCGAWPWSSRRSRATCGCSAAGRARGIAEIISAGSAARIVDHAGQGESVDPGDGQPGLLPGHRMRYDRSAPPLKPGSSS